MSDASLPAAAPAPEPGIDHAPDAETLDARRAAAQNDFQGLCARARLAFGDLAVRAFLESNGLVWGDAALGEATAIAMATAAGEAASLARDKMGNIPPHAVGVYTMLKKTFIHAHEMFMARDGRRGRPEAASLARDKMGNIPPHAAGVLTMLKKTFIHAHEMFMVRDGRRGRP